LKLKNKLMTSYVIIIFGIVLLAFFLTGGGMQKLSDGDTKIAQEGVEKIVKVNNEMTSWILKEAGQRLVKMQSEITANKLKWLLLKQKKPYNYNQLRNNNKIRTIAIKPIYVPGYEKKLVAGNMDLIDIHGTAVIHINKKVEGQNYQRWEKQYPEMWKYVKKSFSTPSVTGYYTFINKKGHPVEKFMALTRVENTPFIVCAYVEINQYFLPLQQEILEFSNRHKALVDKEMSANSYEKFREIEIKGVLGGIILITAGILLALWQADTIAKPLQSLCRNIRKMGKGDFSINTPEKGSSEIAELATTFNALGGELTEYMENLKREMTARQAIESEIAITRKIQETLLPHTFPPFPDKKEFDLHAALVPAKDVSGDFYDFFFVNNETLVLIIADVSGKGLPASLFMAVTRTLLRNLCMNTKEFVPELILNKANDYLCQDNDACMFVTTFLAFYNIKTGRMIYANAGHNEIISREKNSDCKKFGSFPDLPLGVVPDYIYRQAEYNLNINETLVFYTDGVTEAVNKKNEQYGMERFIMKIEEYNSESPLNEIVDVVNSDLFAHQGDKQFDDITIMMIRRN